VVGAEKPVALKLDSEVVTLHTRHPFIIARGGRSEYQVVLVRLSDGDGLVGWGEAYPSSYYGESLQGVQDAFRAAARALPVDPMDLEGAERRFEEVVPRSAAARAALSIALHDLFGQRLGQPLWRVWGLDAARTPRSSFTIGIDTPEKMRAKVLEAGAYSILKIKLGTDHDEALLRTIRDATDKPIRVDANAGWDRARAIAMLPLLKEHGVELLEQPLVPDDLEGLAAVRHASPGIPIVVDESCLVATDIPRVAGAVDGINIKLAKCGSLREALRMIATARAHGMLVMVGCMIETSVAITAAAHFTPLVDVADLDGAALTVDDPFTGARIDGGPIALPTTPGLGVVRR
jgi:L-Ala-D/L-Glu epimerase / N-acetyl-D-glutamate racemase